MHQSFAATVPPPMPTPQPPTALGWGGKQVAQRATIAHLYPMCQHPLISNKPASKDIKNFNSFQIRKQLFF